MKVSKGNNEMPINPSGWRGPFMNTTFIDGSQMSCKPVKNKQNIIKRQSMASKIRKKTLSETLEFINDKKEFEKITLCPPDNIRAIVSNGKTFSVRGTNSDNLVKFNENTGKLIEHPISENKKQKMLKSSKDEFIYINDKYYES